LAREVPYPTLAIGFASSVVAFVALICAMIYNAHMHVRKVEDGYRKMEELKVQAEAADIAKSQVFFSIAKSQIENLNLFPVLF
jgi:histidine kinase 2/3/4 (cytokinin receptor)